MRKPFYWAAREAWYIRHRDASGKLRTIRLASDEAEAQRVWAESFRLQTRTVADTIAAMNLAPVVSKPSKAELREARETAKREAEHLRPELVKPDRSRFPARIAQRDHARDHSPGPRESRMMQFARVLMVAELLAPLRRGATIDDLVNDVSDMMGQRYCDRTIRRDLEFLQSMGVVDLDHRDDGPMIARWIRGRIRSAVIEAIANASSERMEGYANAQ